MKIEGEVCEDRGERGRRGEKKEGAGDTKLMEFSQALKLGGVNNLKHLAGKFDVAMDDIIDDGWGGRRRDPRTIHVGVGEGEGFVSSVCQTPFQRTGGDSF